MTKAGTWLWQGASIRGPAHRASGTPNQDAWTAKRVRGAIVAVVCDGLGSRDLSHVGAKEACRAVVAATRIWAARPAAPVELLLKLIHDIWSIGILPNPKDSCATTCLLSVAADDGRLIAAKLGDGMIAIDSRPFGFVSVGTDRGEGFANQTTGLGIARSLTDWQWKILDESGPDDCLVLATDGVAEDLIPDKQQAFLRFAMDTYRTTPRDHGRGHLVSDLRAWPVPLHGDDKTLVLMWRHMEAIAS